MHTPAGTPARVLTVEDDPIVRADLRLILIDLNLPELDGVEATRRILERRAVPIVALTGYAAGDSIRRAVEAGAVDHVTKPFSEAGLVGTLRDVLAAGRIEAERNAQHDRIRVVIEQMLREHRSEQEVVAVVRAMTGERTPGGLSTALRRCGAWLRSLRAPRAA